MLAAIESRLEELFETIESLPPEKWKQQKRHGIVL